MNNYIIIISSFSFFEPGYWLRAGLSRDRVPEGATFSLTSDPFWGPTIVYTGYRISPGGKEDRAWRYHPPPSGTEVKEIVELYLSSLSVPSW
jgi:hypothetical protein